MHLHLMSKAISDSHKVVGVELRIFSPRLKAEERFLTSHSTKISKYWKKQAVNEPWAEFIKTMKQVQVSYLRMQSNIGFFEKKRFQSMMIKDDPLVFIGSIFSQKIKSKPTDD